MGTISSVFQGTLFGVMNAAILVYVGDRLHNESGVPVPMLPRLVVFHFCMCFVLGLVFMESISARLDPDHGPIVGPMGTFLATILALYFTEIAVLLTHEHVLLTPFVFAVAYTYGQAKAINHNYTKFGPFVASVVFMFALVVLLVDSSYIDEFANQVGALFDTGESNTPKSYLMQPGSLFAVPFVVPVFVTVAAYGLMYTPLHFI